MSEPMYCINHPNVETYLRCNKCGKPICAKCAVRTPVGYRCRQCVNAQQQVFYADFRPVHYLVAAVVALPLALVAGWLIPSLGWYAIILGPLAGGGIAEVARWAIGRRRGPYTWLVVCGCIIVGALPWMGGLMGLVWAGVYLVTAVGAAYARLRPGRHV
jgi:hypothetical protein